MVLTSAEVKLKGVVENDVVVGWRGTTYDATVGCIIQGGVEIAGNSFVLAPRSIVWVVSGERFKIPPNLTGLATLKTQWTHKGLLCLNVGVVDPGWEGPLSTALVNFGNSGFPITKGEPFFRLLFHEHAPTTPNPVVRTMDEYKRDTLERSRQFASTFLDMEKLTLEVSDKVLQMPRWALRFTIWGLLIAVVSIFAPIAYGVWTDYALSKAHVEMLEKRIEDLEAKGEAVQTPGSPTTSPMDAASATPAPPPSKAAKAGKRRE